MDVEVMFGLGTIGFDSVAEHKWFRFIPKGQLDQKGWVGVQLEEPLAWLLCFLPAREEKL